MQNITPFLWFDTQAEQAMRFYASIFPRFKEIAVRRAQGTVISVEFEVNGQRVIGLNGGPVFKFTEAFSWLVPCDTQAEIDDLWTKLTADGGEPGRCGWLKDKFGLSWQVVPTVLTTLLSGPDPASAGRAAQAMMKMNKLDIAALQRAYDGDSQS